MNKRLVFMVMIVGMFLSFTACSKGLAINSGPTINSIEDLTKFLASSDQNTAEKPYTINLALGYGTDLGEVRNVINNFGRYVNLDLSKSIELTSIGEEAFYECTTLTGITIPRNVTSIGEGAFNGTALTSITVDANNPNFASERGILYNKAKTILIRAPQGISGNVTIPNSVTSIGEGAFAGCTALTSVTIPNSVTSIGGWAFYYCIALTSVTIPNSVTYIGEYAFIGCTALTSVTLSRSTGYYSSTFPDTARIIYSD